MFKHHYRPHSVSYFNGVEKINTYKCEFCGKIISSGFDLKNLDKARAKCQNKMSKAILRETISGEYDGTTHNKTIYYILNQYKTNILKRYNVLMSNINTITKKIKIKGFGLWLYIMSLKIQ